MIRLDYLKRCSQRITITLPYAVYERLLGVSDSQGRSASNLGAFLIERALDTFYADL
jgi:hypothetical protein